MIALTLFIKNIFGWITLHWKIVVGIVAVLIVVIGFGLTFRACNKSKAKVDLETVDKINSKNEAEAKKAVREAVEQNLEVTTTVDNRTTLAETNVVERDRLIDEKIKVVNQKLAEAKVNGDVTQEQVQCALVPSDCQ